MEWRQVKIAKAEFANIKSFQITWGASHTRFFYKQNFYGQRHAEIGKKIKQKLSNALRLNFSYLKIIRFLYPRYHPKIIGDTLKNVEKNKYVCLNEVT